MRKGWRVIGLLLVLWGTRALGQELSQDVYPSEDELWEALREGVITYEQYEVLRDLFEQGVDSTARHLLDQIPNLIYLYESDSAFADPLESDQSSGFRNSTHTKGESELITGRLSYQHLMLMDEQARSWYRGRADLTIVDRWRASFRFSRERSGRERITARSLGYRSRSGHVRRVEIGTFTNRFGLGLLFGHRGRVLGAAAGLGGESWLNPAYGGYNGVATELNLGKLALQTLVSTVRDSTHQLLSGGVEVRSTGAKFRPGIVFGGIVLENRQTGGSLEVPMASVMFENSYSSGRIGAEIGRQWGSQAQVGSLVAEGIHRSPFVELRYAVWQYSHDFIDLTSGGKSGVLYQTDTLESVAFAYRSRRSGQTGAILKTTMPLGRALTMSNSLLHASNTHDDSRQQLCSDVTYVVAADYTLRLAYLGDWRRQALSSQPDGSGHQFRVEGRYDGDRISARCYIGYRVDIRSDGRAALFLSGRYRGPDRTAYEVWSNFSKIGPDGLECWYLFGRGSWRLSGELSCGVKMSHSYNRDSGADQATQLSMELAADL